MTDDTDQPPLNREQRRAQKYHPGRNKHRQDNLQTQRENQSGFLAEPPEPLTEGPVDAAAASTTQTATHATGAGTGGAVEGDERVTHHEGTHLGNEPNS